MVVSTVKIIGVVLAGGQSARMHQDKTQLVWGGRTLVQHTQHLLESAGCDHVLISSNAGDFHNAIADRYPGCGPLAGIDATLDYILEHYSEAKAMLVMPVDMPLMTKQLVNDLIEHSVADKAVHYSLGHFPLLLPTDQTLSKTLASNLELHKTGFFIAIKHLLTQIDCQQITLDESEKKAFYNCNTPEEWEYLMAHQKGDV